jgi:hypothetical protein
MSNPWNQIVTMMVGQLPALLAYVGGIVFAIIFLGRYPRPALLALLGCVVLLAASIGHPILQTTILSNRGSRTMASTGQLLSVLSLGFSVLRAGGFVLLICGVFVGRSQAAIPSAFPMADVARPRGTPPPLR